MIYESAKDCMIEIKEGEMSDLKNVVVLENAWAFIQDPGIISAYYAEINMFILRTEF